MLVDILGFEGLYKVSEEGVVRSSRKQLFYKNGRKVTRKAKDLKIQMSGVYPLVVLHKNSAHKVKLIHRLIAEHFIPNEDPEVYTIVNHKDGNKQNYAIDNLEWVTPSENTQHAVRIGLFSTVNEKTRYGDAYRFLRDDRDYEGLQTIMPIEIRHKTILMMCEHCDSISNEEEKEMFMRILRRLYDYTPKGYTKLKAELERIKNLNKR